MGRPSLLFPDALQVPCEVIFGLIGAEAPPEPGNANHFDERAVGIEHLKPPNRTRLALAGVSAAIELQYDKVWATRGT